jgi:hypothetical protein
MLMGCVWFVYVFHTRSYMSLDAINKHHSQWQMVAEGFNLICFANMQPLAVSSVYAGPFLLSVRTNQGSQASPVGCMWAGYVLLHFLNLQ